MELQQKVQGTHQVGQIFHLPKDPFHFFSLLCLLLLWASIDFIDDDDEKEEEKEEEEEDDEEEKWRMKRRRYKVLIMLARFFHLSQDFLFLFDTLFVSLMGGCDYHLLRHNPLHQV